MAPFRDDMSSAAPLGDAAGLYEGFYGGFGGGHGFSQLGASTSSVLLDGKTKDGLDAAAAMEMPKRKGGGERDEKTAMALKSHSEAERRRRESINAHLTTLRSMVPCTDKMDKAALLAEVMNHVKKLKNNAARIGKHCPVPSDTDEVTVEVQEAPHSTISNNGPGRFLIKATLSCDDCADLFMDVKRALQPLKLKVVGSEVTTLGGRVRFTFLMSCEGDVTVASVRQALNSVLDKVNPAFDFTPRESLLSKRRRVSTFESSSSSS